MDKLILDPCCGGRMFWFDKNNPHALFCDCRQLEPETLSNGQTIAVKPDMIADVTELPFEDESFWHIVFDPPHVDHAGPTSWLCKKYGCLPKGAAMNWLADAFDECWRVLRRNGTLVFKWNEVQIPLSQVLAAIGREPLYGHRSGKQSKTHWLCFMKIPEVNDRGLH